MDGLLSTGPTPFSLLSQNIVIDEFSSLKIMLVKSSGL